MQAKSVMQPAVEQSDVQRALLSVTAGDLPPNWMNTQVRAHSQDMHACCFYRRCSEHLWTCCAIGQKGRVAAGGYDDTWLRSATVSGPTGLQHVPCTQQALQFVST